MHNPECPGPICFPGIIVLIDLTTNKKKVLLHRKRIACFLRDSTIIGLILFSFSNKFFSQNLKDADSVTNQSATF
jgi:hypothetical protein